ncbi:MAG: PIG-L family deacetylase [Bacilli bacterium]
MKNFKKLSIALIIIIAIVLLFFLFDYLLTPKPTHDFNNIDLDGINKIMIVAHPDDEMLWGGKELIENDYLVVCITCGKDKSRVKEFVKVMDSTNDKYIMLGYPDKTNGERDNWNTVREDISKDISTILNLKDWEMIVTHNPLGEYGHIHHKMSNQIVTSCTSDKDKLFYFGKYYSKKKIGNIFKRVPVMDKDILNRKIEVLKLYKTQSFIMTTFDHMYEYEDLISFNDWKDGVE